MQLQGKKGDGSSEPTMNARNRAGARRSWRVTRVISSRSPVTVSAAVGEWALEIIPDQLVGIEFRRVRREAPAVEARRAGEALPALGPAVNRAAIPEHDDRP